MNNTVTNRSAEATNPMHARENRRCHEDDALTLFALPFGDLVFKAQGVHRSQFDPNEIQLSALLSIKTGGCPEDCGYCTQSARFRTGVDAEPLMAADAVLAKAQAAKEAGASRFCMGAA